MSDSGSSRQTGNNINERILALRLSSDPTTGQLVYLPIRGSSGSEEPDQESSSVINPGRGTSNVILNANGEAVSRTTLPNQTSPSTAHSTTTTTQTLVDIRSNSGGGTANVAVSTQSPNGPSNNANANDDDDEGEDDERAEGMIEQTANNLIQLLFGVTPYDGGRGDSNTENVRNLVSRPALFGGPGLFLRSGGGMGIATTATAQGANGRRLNQPAESPEFVDQTLLPETYSRNCGIGTAGKLSNESLKTHIVRCLKNRNFLNTMSA